MNNEDIINSTIVEKRAMPFDQNSNVTYKREDIEKKANSDDGIINHQIIYTTITESGIELQSTDKICYCYRDNMINRVQDCGVCTGCGHIFHLSHCIKEKTGRIKTIQKTLRDGTIQSFQVDEQVRYCKRCYYLLELPRRFLVTPLKWFFAILSYPLGHIPEKVIQQQGEAQNAPI